jgi:ArsR family transcriptional regulator, arsenate/arsenite/antimonite-responsive transcriptional repressor
MTRERAAVLFGALSSEPRLRILELLRGRALCVGALAARLDLSPSAVSQHLRILRNVGLVVADKRGQFVHYVVDSRALDRSRKTAEAVLSLSENQGGR